MADAAAAPAPEVVQATPISEGDEKLQVMLQSFLDEWVFRIVSSPVGKMWSKGRTMSLLLDVLGMIGVTVPEDKRVEVLASDEDGPLISAIIEALSGELKDSFEAMALQIQTVLHESTRILTASEADGDDEVADLFEEAGAERGGLPQQVLKASVVHAAKEVQKLRKIHTTWRKNTDDRIDRLLVASETAEHCQQQLLALEAQLSEARGDQKSKSKGLLMNMADGNDKTLKHTIFSGWLGYLEKVHAENEIRKRFKDIIITCERKLFQYKEAQIANIRGVLMKGAMEDKDVLIRMVWKFWLDEVKERKADGDTAEAMKAVQDRLNSFEQSQKEKAGQFMTRMAAGNDASLTNLCLEAWIKFHQDYYKEKELEDKVKAAEAAFKAHMDAKKEEAKAVMDRMLAGTAHGLLSLIVQNWSSWLKEEKKQKELEFALQEQQDKFKSLNGRAKGAAHGAQNRVNEQINMNLMTRVWTNWIIETKANRVENHYNAKYESKRRQLHGVQNLFKSFAMQLEQNLGGDDDSSSRTDRRSKKHGSKMSKGAEGTVSLPDINQKQAGSAA